MEIDIIIVITICEVCQNIDFDKNIQTFTDKGPVLKGP